MDMKVCIKDLALHDACVRRCLSMKETGHCTYEEALESMVLALAASNKTLIDLVIKQANEMPRPDMLRLSTDRGRVDLGTPV